MATSFLGGGFSKSLLADIPDRALETLIPSFGIVSRVFADTLGIDITKSVAIVFITFTLAKSVHYVWDSVCSSLTPFFTSKITIPAHQKVHDDVLQWVSKNIIDKESSLSAGARTLTAGTGGRWDDADEHGIEDTGYSPVRYEPAFSGKTWFFRGWNCILFQRIDKVKTPIPPSFDRPLGVGVSSMYDVVPGSIVLTCIGLSVGPLKRFLHDCRKASCVSERAMTNFYIQGSGSSSGGGWGPAIARPSRPMDTIDIEQDKKVLLLKDVRLYLRPAARRYYARRGIPYRRGFLFWGPPGTGKTSMSLALAGKFGLQLYILNLGSYAGSGKQLEQLFQVLPSKCIVLIEDIDSAGIKRESMRKQKKEKSDQEKVGSRVNLSDLLNAIDGITSREGRVLIMTTNNPETLDPALIRPGRIDHTVYFGPVSTESAEQIYMRMYTKDVDDYDSPEEMVNEATRNEQLAAVAGSGGKPILLNDQVRLQKMAEQFARAIPPEKFTPAEVQNFLLMKHMDPSAALADVDAWVVTQLEYKEQQRLLSEEDDEDEDEDEREERSRQQKRADAKHQRTVQLLSEKEKMFEQFGYETDDMQDAMGDIEDRILLGEFDDILDPSRSDDEDSSRDGRDKTKKEKGKAKGKGKGQDTGKVKKTLAKSQSNKEQSVGMKLFGESSGATPVPAKSGRVERPKDVQAVHRQTNEGLGADIEKRAADTTDSDAAAAAALTKALAQGPTAAEIPAPTSTATPTVLDVDVQKANALGALTRRARAGHSAAVAARITPSSALFPSDAKGSRPLTEYFFYQPHGADASPEEKRRQERSSEFFKGAMSPRRQL